MSGPFETDGCELATVHLTDGDLANLERITAGARPFHVLAMRYPFGYWVRMPQRGRDDVRSWVEGFTQAGFGEEFIRIAYKAIEWGQLWLVFDFERDADPEDDLPTFAESPDTRSERGALNMACFQP